MQDDYHPASALHAAPGARLLRMPSRVVLALLAAAVLAVWFGGLDYRKLADPDEGRYAEIPREMVQSGDWVTPRLNGVKYFEKPPLQYWATSISYSVFGMNDWSTRLWPALTGFLGLVLTWLVARNLFGGRAALYAAAALGSSVYYVAFAQIATLDMGLTLFMTAALVSFVLAMQSPPASRREAVLMLACWASMAAAVLSKGLIGVVLPGLTLVAYSLLQRDASPWRRLHPLKGATLFTALCAPWFVRIAEANPEFAHFFFVHEHFERFTSTVHHRPGPFWYFVPILLIGLLPWTWLAGEACVQAWRRRAPSGSFSPEVLLLAWVTTIFVFFSVSGSKLPAYVLPAVPAIALLAGAHMARLSERQIVRRVVPALLLAGCMLFVVTQAVEVVHSAQAVFPLYEGYSRWLEGASMLLVVTSTALALGKRLTALRVTGLALAVLLSVQLVVAGFESLSPLRSAYAVAQTIRPYLKAGTEVFSVGRYDQSLPPYLRRPVVLVAYTDELKFGLEQEPDRWLPSLDDFAREWTRAPSAVAIMAPEAFRALSERDLPFEVLSRDGERIVVRRPDPFRRAGPGRSPRRPPRHAISAALR